MSFLVHVVLSAGLARKMSLQCEAKCSTAWLYDQ